MNERQVTSVILSVLLASTLGHEYLQHNHIASEAKAIHGHHHQDRSHHHEDKTHELRSALLHHPQARNHHQQFRAESPTQCGWECNGQFTPSDIEIIIRETIHLIAVVNITAQVGIAFDYEAGYVAVLSINTSEAFIVNVKTGIGYYIKGHCWNASRETIEVYLNKVINLSFIWNLGVKLGLRVDTGGSVDKTVGNLVGKVLVNVQVIVSGDGNAAVKVLMSFATKIIITYKATLLIIIRGNGSSSVGTAEGLTGLVNFLAGLTVLFKELKITLERNVKFDLVAILQSSNGIESLAVILKSISAVVSLSTVLEGVTPEKLLSILATFGGTISTTADGIIVIVYQLILLINRETKDTGPLINALIRYYSIKGRETDIKANLDHSITILISALSISGTGSSSVKAIIEFFTKIKENRLVVNNINISAFITLLASNDASSTGLVGIILFLIRIKAVVDIAQTLPALLLAVFQLVESVAGIAILGILVPGLRVVGTAITEGFIVNVYEVIVAGASLTAIIASGFDLKVIVGNIQFLGTIVQAFIKALKALQSSSNGSVDFWQVIGGSVTVKISFTVWFKGVIVGHTGGGLPTIRTIPPITFRPTLIPITFRPTFIPITWHFGSRNQHPNQEHRHINGDKPQH